MGEINTKFVEHEYDYVKPASLDEVLDILAEKKDKASIYAGGTDLLVHLKMGKGADMEVMVDINGIDELFGVTKTDNEVRIGGAEKIWVLETHPVIKELYPALAKAMSLMASISVRNMASIGGNFCNASPVADTVGPCMCYKGQVELKSKERGTRLVDATEFFVGPGRTVIEPDEILSAIILPVPKENTGDSFTKVSRVRPDIAKISFTCAITRDGDKVETCRIAMGTVAPTPKFFGEISSELDGKKMTRELIQETADKLEAAIKPRKKSRSSTPEYKKAMTQLMAKENLETAWRASGGELA